MQAGVYRISNTWSMQEIIDCISSGKIATITVTIPEGYTVKQIEDLLAKKGIVTPEQFQEALMADYDYPFLEGVTGTGPQRMEGFLFPFNLPAKAGYDRGRNYQNDAGQVSIGFHRRIAATGKRDGIDCERSRDSWLPLWSGRPNWRRSAPR